LCAAWCALLLLQVILDVVFNHTAEGNEKGPTLSFRGLDNRVYYMLAPLGEYYNYRSVATCCISDSICLFRSCCPICMLSHGASCLM
jgi:hypothetical protein